MKNVLPVCQIITSGNMSANVTSSILEIEFLDNIAIQLNFSGTPTGTFQVQVSLDYNPGTGGTVLNAGTWTALNLEDFNQDPPVASGSSGSIIIDLNQLSIPYLRVVYVAGSGSGTLNAFAFGKTV